MVLLKTCQCIQPQSTGKHVMFWKLYTIMINEKLSYKI